MKLNRTLILICLLALVLRLASLFLLVDFPGIADPNHYFNMAHRLLDGQGFTIDYIWQYNLPPDSIVHPEEHWMPLTAVFAAAGMALFGESVHAALLPFALMGALLPLIGYAAARQLDLSRRASYFAALMLAVLPEYLLYSVRTDTLIPSALFVCASILLLTYGLRRGSLIAYVGSGLAAGLGYLTRSDAALILPMLVVTLLVYLWRREAKTVPVWRLLAAALIVPLVFALVALPWVLRNLDAIGQPGSPETNDMFFFTDHADHYAYGRTFTLETMLASATPAQLIGKRAFELAAAIKTTIVSFDVVLPVAVAGGLILLLSARDAQRLRALAPVLILLLGILVAYPILIPYKSQAGSFKKAYLSIMPLLVPLGAYAFDRAIADSRIRAGAMALTALLAGANAFDLVRLDAAASRSYLTQVEAMAAQARQLPDLTGDGAIILMAQDPYMMRYVGLQSVMFPNEPRDVIIEVAQRYGVDYLLFPPARPSLDGIESGQETDPRFVQVSEVAGTSFVFYRIDADAGGES